LGLIVDGGDAHLHRLMVACVAYKKRCCYRYFTSGSTKDGVLVHCWLRVLVLLQLLLKKFQSFTNKPADVKSF